ncbi:MAG: thioredoxin-disulfide reductase, partial [Mesorhizobium sp.]
MTSKHAPVLIIGSGPAGYTAAIYAARAMLKPMLVAGLQQGGQLMITTDVENYPGFADPIQGPWLMEQMLKQAEHVGTDVINDIITEVDLNVRPFRAKGDSGATYTADALIIATGAQAKWLGIPSEQTFIRAERILSERLFKKDNVRVIWDTVVDEITGQSGKMPLPPSVEGLKLRNLVTGQEMHLTVDGVFVAIGHAPAVELFAGKLKQKPNGYLWTAPDSTCTDV